MAEDKRTGLSRKEKKRQLKVQRKLDKDERKRARGEEKQARKLARRQQRNALAYQSMLDRAQAVALLETLVAGVKAGKVSIEHAGEQLSLTPADIVGVRVKGRQTHKSESLTIRVRWPRMTTREDSAKLKVTGS